MKKINFVKIGWGSLSIGFVCFLIIIGIAFDIRLNQKAEFPWFTLHLIIITIISGVIGIIFSTKFLMNKIRRKRR